MNANVERSVLDQAKQLGMYKKEHENFKLMLQKDGEHEAMWRHLDFLLGDMQ